MDLNASPKKVEEMNDLPVKAGGERLARSIIRDVAHVRDGFAPQTNIVRLDGQRGSFGLDSEDRQNVHAGHRLLGMRSLLPKIAATLPPRFED